MNLGVSFAPLVPAYMVWAAFAVAVLISLVLLIARSRGASLRALALGLMVLALANPSLTREDRDPIPSVARARTSAIAASKLRLHARPSSSGSSVFRALRSALPRPAQPTAKPMAPSCSQRCRRRSPMCRLIVSPAPS